MAAEKHWLNNPQLHDSDYIGENILKYISKMFMAIFFHNHFNRNVVIFLIQTTNDAPKVLTSVCNRMTRWHFTHSLYKLTCLCLLNVQVSVPPPSSQSGVIAGVIVGVFLLITAIVVLGIFIRRRIKSRFEGRHFENCYPDEDGLISAMCVSS